MSDSKNFSEVNSRLTVPCKMTLELIFENVWQVEFLKSQLPTM